MLGGQTLLLADTGPFCRFADAGDEHIDALAEYAQTHIRIVHDVALEIDRLSKTSHPRLKRLQWIDFPPGEPITITDARLLSQIEDICAGRRRQSPGHFMEDRGEIATILVAKRMNCPVIVDEKWGREIFAPKKNVSVFTTEDIAVDMAVNGNLTDDAAFDVFRRVFHRSRVQFDIRVNEARAA
jgi:hypothetical protein